MGRKPLWAALAIAALLGMGVYGPPAVAYVGLCCGKCGGNMPMNIPGGGVPETYEFRAKLSPSYHGRLVLLNFWGMFCPPCREEMPALQDVWRRYRARSVVVLAVAEDRTSRRRIAAYVRRHGYTFPILLDPDGGARRGGAELGRAQGAGADLVSAARSLNAPSPPATGGRVVHSYIPCGSYGKGGHWVIRLGAVPVRRCRACGGFPYAMGGWILVELRRSDEPDRIFAVCRLRRLCGSALLRPRTAGRR